MKTLKYVSGNFVGNFYTHQKSALSIGEKIPDGGLHNVHVYKGELTEVNELEEFKPEEHLNRDGMLLHNVTNIQITPGINSSVKEKKIYDFEQLVLKNVVVENSWESNNKTYGILKGELVGKIKENSAIPVSHDDNSPIPPPPIGGSPIQPPPVGGDPIGWGKFIPPVITNNGNGGCFTSIWNVLKWILLLLLVLFLLKQCVFPKESSDNTNDDDCVAKMDSLIKITEKQQIQIDSLQHLIIKSDSICDSKLEKERLQCEIDNISSEIYFNGGTTDIRKYSEDEINKIVTILNKYPSVSLQIQGFYNGIPDKKSIVNLDLKRANRVKELVVDKGVAPERISTVGLGNTKPIVDEDDMQEDAYGNPYNANMRVEIKIVKY
jgi:outer membrane protein OmpA-like peptidoglycan-associated protein